VFSDDQFPTRLHLPKAGSISETCFFCVARTHIPPIKYIDRGLTILSVTVHLLVVRQPLYPRYRTQPLVNMFGVAITHLCTPINLRTAIRASEQRSMATNPHIRTKSRMALCKLQGHENEHGYRLTVTTKTTPTIQSKNKPTKHIFRPPSKQIEWNLLRSATLDG
jgi:hypothetical protein